MRLLQVITVGLVVFQSSGQFSDNYEPVALLHRNTSSTRRQPVVRATPREVRESFMRMHEVEADEGRSLSEELTTEPAVYDSEETASFEEYEDDASTEIPAIASQSNVTGTNRTKLYPIGRLWERSPVDFWSVLNAAISCLWSGLGFECFSFKVVPMMKSLIGYESVFSPSDADNPFYVSPRVARDEKNEGDEGEDKTEVADSPRRRKHHVLKFAKWALYGFAAAKTVLVPFLSALSLVSGKALVLSLLAGALTLAIAWNGLFGRQADRRVYDAQPQSDYSSYSTLYV